MYDDYELPIRVALWCLLITAAWHLFVGVSGLIFAPRGGYTPALLFLFIVSGLFAFGVLTQILFHTRPRRRLYSTASVLMVVFLLAYADVHVYGVLESVAPVDLTYRAHSRRPDNGLTLVWHSVSSDPAALVSKTIEAIAAGVFGVYALLDK